jgi:hypothetical protein
MCGLYLNDEGIRPGNIILTNLRAKNSDVISDIILVGERSPFKRTHSIEIKDFPLYDKMGNSLFRIIDAAQARDINGK